MARIGSTLIQGFALAALVLVGCGKKEKPPPAPPPATTQPKSSQPASLSAPAGVPQALKDRVARDWPKIEELGNAFLAKFDEAKKAQNAGDRVQMQTAIDGARDLYENLMEQWAEINNWVADEQDEGRLSDAAAEACYKWMGTYERKARAWTKKAKALKELSAVR